MVQFKGFATLQEAEAFKKNNKGVGLVCWEERTPKRKQLTHRGIAYMDCVMLGGLDAVKYPYCVQWNI